MSGTRSRRPSWDPAQYARFADDRIRPAHDLIDRIPLDRPRIIWDLGCGTGEITERLAERWPDLRVVFAILAGGGPFQFERLISRGVPGRELLHENVYFETASYGRRALDLCLATFGVRQLLFGSDAPVIDPKPTLDAVRGFGDAVADALCNQNPTRLLS